MLTKRIEPITGKVPLHGLPMGVMGGPAIARGALVLALETFDHYSKRNINHARGETHDA